MPRDQEFERQARQAARNRNLMSEREQELFAQAAAWGAEEALKHGMKLCGFGMSIGMVRVRLHNFLVKITGDGEGA